MSSITTVHVQIARTVINLVEKKIVTLLQRTLSDDSCKPKLRIRNNRLLAKDHANRKLHEIAANAEIKIRYDFFLAKEQGIPFHFEHNQTCPRKLKNSNILRLVMNKILPMQENFIPCIY